MAISDEEREAYKEGQEDSGSPLAQLAYGFFEGKSDSEMAAYQKGVDGEQLDADKKDK